MANKRIKRIIHVIFTSFDIRTDCPKDEEMESLMKKIQRLEYDDVTKGKERMRNDFLAFREDFRKSVLTAKRKVGKGGCLAQ